MLEIHKPGDRQILFDTLYSEGKVLIPSDVLVSRLPPFLLEEPCVVVHNYPGKEGDPLKSIPHDISPTFYALAALLYAISINSEQCRGLTFSRENSVDNVWLKINGLQTNMGPTMKKVLIELKKNKEGDYEADDESNVRVVNHILRRNGVLAAAPATTTMDNGLRLNLRTGAVRIARTTKSHFGALAIETTSNDEGQQVVRDVHFEEIVLPTVSILGKRRAQEIKEINMDINWGLTLLAMSMIANRLSLSGDQNLGELKKSKLWLDRSLIILDGIRLKGVTIDGGVLSKENIKEETAGISNSERIRLLLQSYAFSWLSKFKLR